MWPVASAEQWADEAIRKYGTGAAAWLERWKAKLQRYPEDLVELGRAIDIVNKEKAEGQ